MAAYMFEKRAVDLSVLIVSTNKKSITKCTRNIKTFQQAFSHNKLSKSQSSSSLLKHQLGRNIPYEVSALSFVRHNSTLDDVGASLENPISETANQLSSLPSSDVATTAAEILQPVAEIPFSELGLGGYTPVGLLQSALEFLHISAGLPWWAAIATGTIIARIAVFPIIVRNQRYSGRMNNVMPTFQKLTAKFNEARTSGDQTEVMMASNEMQRFMKKHDINPLKSFMGVAVQAPIFISFFIGLRKMATLPVESMQVGGMSWFTDLTTSDPYYIMPAMATLSMLAVLELGGEAGVSSAQMQKMKIVFRVLPFLVLPFIVSMPKAVFCYWITSNCVSVAQVGMLRFPSVREALNIPVRVKHRPEDMPKQEGIIQSIKSGWKNAQTSYDFDQAKKSQIQRLRESGTGPVPQTFSYDPTKQQPTVAQPMSTTTKNVRKKIR
ncbi:mitochondrial inner membrane protein OXA1L-like [Antedon mediterranea]|uniref:mitochondrial inner membrane protein OXA1L-like n=1 Tax=Antedon mediterranea TaxID=105859 RepID=UPI003AF767F1